MNPGAKSLPFLIALNNVRSMHNIGAIFRTADAVGCQGLILGGLTPMPPRHEIDKTALGAVTTVPWHHCPDLAGYLRSYRDRGYALIAVEQTDQATDLFETSVPFPSVLVFGHERMGVEQSILDLCSLHIVLPMRGRSAHSLNVSSTVAIASYELLRQYRQRCGSGIMDIPDH